ncbi:hypothetical protein K1940_001803 [Salmonella enterica subsp. enterica serovar Larochelle]|nr:hypothetical protein [Salmonella enterica subsp. enterica serovar Larochelle]
MSWIVGIATSLIGTAMGAAIGALTITKLQDSKNKYPRQLLRTIISEFRGYESYQEAVNQFNKRSIVEKKAVLVALKNLGVPVKINIIDDRFDIDNVAFSDIPISIPDLEKMESYINLGLCDKLFFNEIDSGFHQSSPKIIRARELAIKILETMKRQEPSITAGNLMKAVGISLNQFEVVYVFWQSLDVTDDIASASGVLKYDESKINIAIQDVKNGIVDHLFYWDHRAFNNINEQRFMAQNINNSMVKPG